MNMIILIIDLISGAIGGNVAGALLKGLSLGTLGNSIVGMLGGGIGAAILGMFGASTTATGGLDIRSIIGSIVSGGLGGSILLAIIGLIKGESAKI